MLVDIPAAVFSSLGVHSHDNTLASKFLRGFCDKFRPVYGGGIYRDLIRPFPEKSFEIVNSPDASADRERDKHIGSYLAHHFHYRIPSLTGSCDIQEYQLIRPGRVICLRDLHRISRVFEIDEIHSLYHPAFIHIQTGDNSLCKHFSIPPFQASQSSPGS